MDFNGVARGAKLAFFDIGKSKDYSLYVPSNLASELFLPLYDAGARVFSNSWGSYGVGANEYTGTTYAVATWP